jgi:hypothetical protein
MSTTGRSLIDPISEVWGGMLSRYFSAVGMVVLHYDLLLTINEEVRPDLPTSWAPV